MTIIGLTGGIAAGKSTAAEILREYGATVIDADRLGHRSYEPGTPGFQKVVNAFGHDLVAKDGTIDRRILGGKVFGAPGELERLNAIVWPEIRALIKDEVKQIRASEDDPIIVLEAAVLLEAKWQDLCDEVWVVLTPVKTAVARLKERNNLAEDAAMARINAQMSNKERSAQADVKIENAGDEDELRQRVERAWKALLQRRTPKGKKTAGGKATKTGSIKAAEAAAPKTTAKAAPKAASKPSTTTRAAASAKPATKAAAKPAAKAPATASAKPAAKAAPKTTASKAAPKTAAAKPAAKAAPKATAKAAKPAAKPAAKASKAAPSRAAAKPAAKKAASARTK
ncbi:MAG: dephospho-CoA kinase [Dehalococcoidia bacterium]|nr:dephospho-CoA kinase [Dehalococcoidia bacterium]